MLSGRMRSWYVISLTALSSRAFPLAAVPLAAVLLAAVLLTAVLLAAFASGALAELPPFVSGDFTYVLTSEYDYSAGSDAVMDINPPWETALYLNDWVGDTEAVFYNGLIYVVSRWGADHITVMDPSDDLRIVRQFSVGAGSNPQHICFVDEHRAFVTRYETTELWEVDPSTGDHTDTIDLSPLADADGLPEMHKMAIHGDRLYVTIQRLDRGSYWNPEGTSYLAVIDLATNVLIDIDPETPGTQGIVLTAPNPNGGIWVDPLTGDFLISELGFYGVADGGIERIDPDTHASLGFALTEATLGGDLHAWTTGNGWEGYAVSLSSSWTTRLVTFDLQSGQVTGEIATSSEYAYAHVVVDLVRHELIVCDRTYSNPGLRIYDTRTLEPLTSQPIDVGLYPHWLLAVPGPDSGVHNQPATFKPRLMAFPQPAVGPVTVRWIAQARLEGHAAPGAAWGPRATSAARGPRATSAAWGPRATSAAWGPRATSAAWGPRASGASGEVAPPQSSGTPETFGDLRAPETVGDLRAPETVGDLRTPETFGDLRAAETVGDLRAAGTRVSLGSAGASQAQVAAAIHGVPNAPPRILIFDATGRQVTTLRPQPTGGIGVLEAVWDGTDSRGRRLPCGIYLAHIGSSDPSIGCSIRLLR